jgi:Tol biopolymer transport system component/DNA-binding winged helix-turn-helix (wHTH) protein
VACSEEARIIRFGVFEVDLNNGELRRNGLKVKLQEQPFQVLARLLEHPGEVVTREDLRRSLWPADTFVDFEHGLNAAIKRLRDALGDSAETPVFIETLPKRGYRFLVPAIAQETPGEAAASRLELPRRAMGQSRRLILTLVGAAAVIATVYMARRHMHIPSTSSAIDRVPPMRVVPLTSFPGSERDPAFSPDGKQVAFVWDADTRKDVGVYVKLIGSEQPLRISQGSGSVCCPAWSSDGHYVAFQRCTGSRGTFVVPALGGPERRLTEKGACIGLTWSPDGKFLAFPAKGSDADPWHISTLSLDTLEERDISSPPANIIGDHLPSFSPDGKEVAFRRISSPWVTDIYLAAVDADETRRLTFDKTVIEGVTWLADGKNLVFASHRAGDMALWKIPVSGGTPERLSVSSTNAERPAISRQGDKLAYTAGSTHTSIWKLDLDASGRALRPAKPLIVSSSWDYGPQFTPDGRKIVFDSHRSGNPEVWVANADGADPIQLTSLKVLSGTPRWSPDGKFIAFDSRPDDHSHIFVIPAAGGTPRQVTSGDFEASVPSWSRDGRWIYFTSNRLGIWQLFKVPPQGGEPIQVTRKGGFAAFESPDGSALYYWKDNDYGIWRMSLPSSEEARILPLRLDWGQWAVLDHGIYFVDRSRPNPAISYFDFSTGRISRVAPAEKSLTFETPAFDVSADGRSLLFVQLEKAGDIMLVENFR